VPFANRRVHPVPAGSSLVLSCLALVSVGCARPPAGPTTVAGSGPAATDCDAPPVAHVPEGCADDEPRPPGAPPVERPGADRDGDGVEDILDVCPDVAGAAEDGCPAP
jgi:hypothetical protein